MDCEQCAARAIEAVAVGLVVSAAYTGSKHPNEGPAPASCATARACV